MSCLELSEFYKEKKKDRLRNFEDFLLLDADDLKDFKSAKSSQLPLKPRESLFVKQNNGSYLLKVEENQALAPVKIIDLQGYNTSFQKALAWVFRVNVVKTFVSVVPIPVAVLPQTLSAVLERFINYIEVLYLARHQEALNLIVEAKLGSKTSPFYQTLGEGDLDHSIQYLRRSLTFIGNVLKNTFSKKESIAEKYMEKILEKHKKIFCS